MTAPVNVVYATDDNGALGCAVSSQSVLQHLRKDRAVNFWILNVGLTRMSCERISDTLRSTGHRVGVYFTPLSADLLDGLLHSKDVPLASYARLFLAELLPVTVDQCVYLDIDTVCTTSIETLYDMPLHSAAMGCVPNYQSMEDSRNEFQRLGMVGRKYFNAGVMLCNLKVWRDTSVAERALSFAREAGARLIMHDQDALNAILHDAWTEIPERWNRWASSGGSLDDCVIHYTMSPKPWHADYKGQGLDIFQRTLDTTAYRGFRPWNPFGLGDLLRKGRRRIPYGPTVARLLRGHWLDLLTRVRGHKGPS